MARCNNQQKNSQKRCLDLADDVTMTSQLKHVIMLNMFIGNFSFGILIIIIHRFTPYMQGKWGNQKRAITLQHIFRQLDIIFN